MSLAQRIKALCDYEGSQKEFSFKVGILSQTINKVINKGTGMSTDTLLNIAKAYPNLNMRWLISGEDPMWLEAPEGYKTNDQVHTLQERAHPEEAYLKAKVLELQEQRIKELEREIVRRMPDVARELGIKPEE